MYVLNAKREEMLSGETEIYDFVQLPLYKHNKRNISNNNISL